MKEQEFNLELTVKYDRDKEEQYKAVLDFWSKMEQNLEALKSKYGIKFSHGEIII